MKLYVVKQYCPDTENLVKVFKSEKKANIYADWLNEDYEEGCGIESATVEAITLNPALKSKPFIK